MRICRRPNEDALARLAAERMAELLATAASDRGQASLALSGGSSPRQLFEMLATHDLPWARVHVFQVDERLVDADSPALNWRTIEEALLRRTAAVGHPLPTHDLPVRFDVIHLGLGTDGHTASWPPGHPVLEATTPIASVENFNGYDRLTLTPPTVNRARAIIWFVPGADKAAIVERLIIGDSSIPASRVDQSNAELFTTGENRAPS